MTQDHTITLGEGVHAPAHARAWVSRHAVGLSPNLVDDALLLVSELVTNAVRHGRGDVELSVRVGADRLRIAVSDRGPEMPIVPDGRPSIDRPSGRGLLIVAATATDWGVTPLQPPPGKTVWADLTQR